MGNITGGKKLKGLLDKFSKMGKTEVLDVGFLRGNIHPDSSLPTAEIASRQEYGGVYDGALIPPRPFMRTTIDKKKSDWIGSVSKELSSGNYDTTKILMRVGEDIKGDLQESIRDFNDPPNAPFTVKKKGFDNPLIDTGYMMQSVDYKITESTGGDSGTESNSQ